MGCLEVEVKIRRVALGRSLGSNSVTTFNSSAVLEEAGNGRHSV